MTTILKITCPHCFGDGERSYEIIPNHPSMRMGSETCSTCHGRGEIIDETKCCECGCVVDETDGEAVVDSDGSICGPCNRGEIHSHQEAA